MDFNLVDLVILIRSDRNVGPGDLLLLLSREFSNACRESVCRWPMRDCLCCSVRPACAWHHVFSQEISPDPEAVRCHQKPSLPFVFSVTLPVVEFDTYQVMECRLVVVGRALPYLGMLLDTVAAVLNRNNGNGNYRVVERASRDCQGTLQPMDEVIDMENLVVLSARDIMERHSWECSQIGIRLLTPLSLRSEGRTVKKFDFRLFSCSLLRRVSALSYYYGECELDYDFKSLSQQSAEIVCDDDHFGYQNITGGNNRMCGITGSGTFSGNFGGLMPFLALGTYFNAGKTASFGMGRYELDVANAL